VAATGTSRHWRKRVNTGNVRPRHQAAHVAVIRTGRKPPGKGKMKAGPGRGAGAPSRYLDLGCLDAVMEIMRSKFQGRVAEGGEDVENDGDFTES